MRGRNYRFDVGVACVAVTWALVGAARGDEVRQFDPPGTLPGRFPLVSELLNSAGIGASNTGAETTETAFVVPGSGPVDLTFKVERDGGSFLYEFGYFDPSRVTADPVSATRDYAVQALSGATSVFDDRTADPGATRTLRVQGGQTLGFFIVPNNTIANFLADPDDFYPPTFQFNGFRAPLFSNSDANPGQFDQLLSFAGNGVTLFTFEDLSRVQGSDNSFVDLGFTVNAQLIPVPEPAAWAAGLLAVGLLRRRPTHS
jgi:hypothetical protein